RRQLDRRLLRLTAGLARAIGDAVRRLLLAPQRAGVLAHVAHRHAAQALQDHRSDLFLDPAEHLRGLVLRPALDRAEDAAPEPARLGLGQVRRGLVVGGALRLALLLLALPGLTFGLRGV